MPKAVVAAAPALPPAPFSRANTLTLDAALGVGRFEGEARVSASKAALAAWRVSEALREGSLSLDLSCSEIADPEDLPLSELPWLQVLDLSENSLRADALGSFSSVTLPVLRALSLRHNAIVGELPASVAAFAPTLEDLNVEGNGLRTIAPGLGAPLRGLTRLSLANNFLTSLPSCLFAPLMVLSFLDLRGNKLTALPASLCACSALAVLHVSDNALTALPEEIGTMSSLRVLNVAKNALLELPTGLAACTKLETLDISENLLTILPGEVIEGLLRLTDLRIASNKLSSLPDALGLLRELRILNVSANALTELPEALGQCTALTEIYANGNAALATLPDSVAAWTQLTYAGFKWTKLKALPDGAVAWKKLKLLDAKGKKKDTLKISEDFVRSTHGALVFGASIAKSKGKK